MWPAAQDRIISRKSNEPKSGTHTTQPLVFCGCYEEGSRDYEECLQGTCWTSCYKLPREQVKNSFTLTASGNINLHPTICLVASWYVASVLRLCGVNRSIQCLLPLPVRAFDVHIQLDLSALCFTFILLPSSTSPSFLCLQRTSTHFFCGASYLFIVIFCCPGLPRSSMQKSHNASILAIPAWPTPSCPQSHQSSSQA